MWFIEWYFFKFDIKLLSAISALILAESNDFLA